MPSWWRAISAAPRGSRFTICAIRPKRTRRCRTRFVKAYSHLSSFREELPFEVWFTRILINGCLDRIKARTRRERWLVPMPESPSGQRDFAERIAGLGTVAGRSRARTRAPAEAGRRAGAAAGAAAVGVHVEPLRGLHVAGGQRADGAQRIDGPRAPVPGDSPAADVARRKTGRTVEAGRAKRRVNS